MQSYDVVKASNCNVYYTIQKRQENYVLIRKYIKNQIVAVD